MLNYFKNNRSRIALNKGLAVAIGIALGAAFDNYGIGIALGIAIAAATGMGTYRNQDNKDEKIMNKPRSFGLHFGLAMILYTILLLGSAFFIRANPQTPWRFILAVLPVLPGFYGAWSVSQEISRHDELQQKMQLEALSFAFGGTVLVALAIGLLDMAGVEQLNGAWFVPIMMALWGLGQWIAKRKYG